MSICLNLHKSCSTFQPDFLPSNPPKSIQISEFCYICCSSAWSWAIWRTCMTCSRTYRRCGSSTRAFDVLHLDPWHWERSKKLFLGENQVGGSCLCWLFCAKAGVGHSGIPQGHGRRKGCLLEMDLNLVLCFLVDANANTVLNCRGFFKFWYEGTKACSLSQTRILQPVASRYAVSWLHELLPSNLGSLVSLVRSILISPSRTRGI